MKTTLSALILLMLAGSQAYAERIALDPSMVKLEQGSSGFAGRLVDEQTLVGDPLRGSRVHASSTWGSTNGARVNVAILDLGRYYAIEDIWLYDLNGNGTFRIQAGEPGNWDFARPLVEDQMLSYKAWKGFTTNVRTRYLRFENTTGYVGVPEVVLYGYPSDLSHFGDGPITDARKAELNQLVIQSKTQPAAAHPRLFGPNSRWVESLKKFDDANPDCTWGGKNSWGYVKNMKSLWDTQTLGGDKCAGKLPTSLAVHPDAKFYLSPIAGAEWDDTRALRLMHLMRRMYACYASGSTTCLYPKADIDQLASAFLTYEFNRQRNEAKNPNGYYPSWHKGWQNNFFDLGAYPAFKFWCILLDTFWDHPALLVADKNYISAELENEINSYLTLYSLPVGSPGEQGRWAVWGGNNWTVILNGAALYWAITFWHEKPEKAQKVFAAVLETNWLHRDFFLPDGAYVEGPSYADASLGPMIDQNALLMGSFNQPYHAIRWKTLSEKTTKWLIENVSTDGKLLDFGDAWARSGYGAFYYLYLSAWEELLELKPAGSTSVNACEVKLFFANNYFAKHFDIPWDIHPLLARDWSSVVQGCNATAQTGVETNHFPDFQLATFRTYLPGATRAAASAGSYLKLAQADQTFLAMTGVPNNYPHREIDFGGMIWSAFGSKLLADYGYGELSGGYTFYDVSGSKGHFVKESDADRLEFSIRMVDLPVTLNNLKVGIVVHFISKELTVGNYISSIGSGWAKVSIPLKDFGVENWRWTAIRGQAGDPWAVPGIEAILFRNLGAISKGHLGLDELRIVSGTSSEKNVLWYGDGYAGSIATGAREEHATNFRLASEEVTGGAEATAKWAKLYLASSGSVFKLNFSNDPNEFVVANTMDYLPIGTNTLILPKATDNGKRGTHRSQFKAEKGTVTKFTLDGRQVVQLDGSQVYGSNRADGNLDYFYRYSVAVGNGNYLVIDSFKTKPGKEDKVQEFWYSLQDLKGASCIGKSKDVTMTKVSPQSVMLASACSHVSETGASEAFGMISAGSLKGAAFALGAPDFLKSEPLFSRFIVEDSIRLMNRLKGWEYRRLARYEATAAAVDEDVRVFLFQSATSPAALPAAAVTKVDCGLDGACFAVQDGVNTLNVQLKKVDGKFQLQGL